MNDVARVSVFQGASYIERDVHRVSNRQSAHLIQ